MRIVFPGQRTWVVKTFVLAGIGAVTQPFWQPYIELYLKKHHNIVIPNTVVTGWVLIAVGVCLYLLSLIINYKEKEGGKKASFRSRILSEVKRLIKNVAKNSGE